MIFDKEDIVFEILDVFFINQKNINNSDSNRNFDAISFRYNSDARIMFEHQEIELYNNSICYFPANVNYNRIATTDKLIVIHFKAFNYHSKEIQFFNPKNSQKYQILFEKILHCWNEREVAYKFECSALLYKIFAELYRDNVSHHNNGKLYNSICYIEKNFTKKDFSLSEAVKFSFLSEPYFRRLFKQEFGTSPKKYIIDKRIEYAKALIITGYFTLYEVSDLCGYNDYHHFTTEFKKLLGIPPSKFKYNYQNR